MSPPLPDVAAPELILILPLSPLLDVPLLNVTSPLTPLLPFRDLLVAVSIYDTDDLCDIP